MRRYKIVFDDNGNTKTVFGDIDPDTPDVLLKVFSDNGNLIYINKQDIIFMRELG